MKGNNTLELNQATLIEALQLWCDATFKTPPEVLSVKQSKDNYSGTTFTVELAEPESPAQPR